jgi:hypothetical protein
MSTASERVRVAAARVFQSQPLNAARKRDHHRTDLDSGRVDEFEVAFRL